MKIKHNVVGMVGTNCYFAVNETSRECLIIDPGDQAERLSEKIKENELLPVAILLTHGHFDHIMAAEALAKEYKIKIYVYEDDAKMLREPSLNCGSMVGTHVSLQADETLTDRQKLSLAGFDIEVLHTPGHTPGGCCYYFAEEGVVFSGDTLFCESVGRTDLPGGSSSALIRSIRERLFALPDLTIVYPGHGEPTKISTEKQYNPFV